MTSNYRMHSLCLCALLALAPFTCAQDEPPPPIEEPQDEPVSQGGYEEAFAFVRDSIALQAYAGVLKGAEKTLDDGAGNSLDRALLLSKLLQERGFRPAITQGRLSGTALKQVIALSQGLQPDPDTGTVPHLNPAADETLSALLADHYWIQIPAGREQWIDLDPTLPDSTPGSTIAGFRKRLTRMPSHLFQLAEINVWVEFTIDKQPVRSRMLRWVKPIQAVNGKPVVLFFVRREADGRFVFSKENRWYPVLWFDGAIQPALNLESEANRLAVRARGVVKPPEVKRIWMDISLHAPGQKIISTRRSLFSTGHMESSRLDEMQVFRFSTGEPASGDLAATASALDLSATTAAAIKPTEYPQVLSDGERNEIAAIADIQRDLAAAIGSVYEAALARHRECVYQAFLSLPGTVHPLVYSVSIAPQTAQMQFDLIDFDSITAAISPSDVQSVASGFTLGVVASHLEGQLLSQLAGNGQAESSLTITRAYNERGARWRAYDVPSMSALTTVDGINDTLLERMEESIQAGKIIILPDRFEDLPLAWWELDGESGTIVGMIEPGLGGARTLPQDVADWPYVASSFAPLFTPAWPEQLASYCRTAATSLRTPDADLDSLGVAEAVVDVYEIVYAALVAQPDAHIAPGVREFFSPLGRILLRGASSSLCREGNGAAAQP